MTASPTAAALASPPSSEEAGPTAALARFIAGSRPATLPENARREGVRTFYNWLGCAIGGAGHETVDIAVAALAPFAGQPQATVLGRAERFDILTAALLNGISSHVFDFDDTHLKTVIHPAGPVASAILALAEHKSVSGADFLNALVVGIEVECRIGNAVYPDHYDTGWHITGTAGVFGAAAAAAVLLKLDEQKICWALGIAASQPVGLREMFGTMTKSFHPGRAAQSGLTAALLAARGYTSSEQGLEARRGWMNVVSTRQAPSEITDGLGERYESALNTYKPFACGIVIHPAIDGCIRLRNAHGLKADDIERIDLKVHPLVLELTGKTAPRTGLEGKFSIYHACAAAIVEGAGGEKQFSDRAVTDPVMVALRQRVKPVIDPKMDAAAVAVAITLRDGRTVETIVEHAVGSLERPMSDRELDAKFADLVAGIIPADRAARLTGMCWGLENAPDMAAIARAGAVATRE